MSALRVCVTGASGMVGARLVHALRERDAHVTVLSRDPARAAGRLAPGGGEGIETVGWDPLVEPAPGGALEGRDAVVNLAGEPIAQRWSAPAKRAIRASRVTGTRNLLAGIEGVESRPRTLVSSSAVGYYGAHGEEPLDEDSPPGEGFLADVCEAWEAEAEQGSRLGMRVVIVRTGVVLDRDGGALAKLLPAFRIGLGGPVAGGRQFISWIHRDDLVGLMLAALGEQSWRGPVNATAPGPVTNREFSRALGRVLGRPALLPLPGAALRALYGEMAQTIAEGARAMPAKALVLGYRFAHPEVEPALRALLAR